ncbi:MAG TPA: BON domain-containing protein [Candidatus Acidoferrales bacterium]|jgi:hypothetical protein|nr:BON domain-containing protein [Candidatus Acidoferrales bacterium]
MFVVSALAAVVACAGVPQAAPVHTRPAASKAAAKPRLPDAKLEAVIRAKFAKSKINADKFTVHVQGGVATIEGKTDVMQHKGTATRMARTAGAVAVSNHVQISEAAKAKAAGNLEKGRRRVQVKRGDDRSDARSVSSQTRQVR